MVVSGEAEGEWIVVGNEPDKGRKREADEDADASGKRQRGEGDTKIPAETNDAASDKRTQRTCAGDVFLAHGIRERLRAELDAAVAESLPFPLVDEEIYEPPKDEDPPESLEQITERVVSSLPRPQAIEALHGFQAMK